MNGLEALEKGFWKLTHKGNINYYNIAQKELEAFEIIKNKKVETYHLSRCKTLIEYNSAWDICGMELTQEEFDLLKEVLL